MRRKHRAKCCRQFLVLYTESAYKILESIVAEDETMFLYYDHLLKKETIMERHRD